MTLEDFLGPREDARVSPHEDLEAHLCRGNVALFTSRDRKAMLLGAIRKHEGQWAMMPLADVTEKGEDGALQRARQLAWLCGRDRFELVECDDEMVPVRMATVKDWEGKP